MIWGETTAQWLWRKTKIFSPWFAWHPIELDDGRWVWFETVYRKLSGSYYHYKLKEQLTTDEMQMVGLISKKKEGK